MLASLKNNYFLEKTMSLLSASSSLKGVSLLIGSLLLFACTHTDTPMTDKSLMLCENKPNCVSTQDLRPGYNIAPFVLSSPKITMAQIVDQAKTLKGAHVVFVHQDNAGIEYKSRFFGFIDELSLRIQGKNLIVRSASQVGYYDFNVNKKRTELLRNKLKEAGLIL